MTQIFKNSWCIVWCVNEDTSGWLRHNSLLNAKLICIVFALQVPDNMCYEMQEHIFIYTVKELDWSTGLLLHWEQFLKLNAIIQHPPFWDYDMAILRMIYWGCGWQCIVIKVHGQSGSTVPRSPGSGILVPCRHGWIFVAEQVWHGMLQTLVLGNSSEQLVWQEQLEPLSAVLQVQQMWAAYVVQVGVMQVVPLRSGG